MTIYVTPCKQSTKEATGPSTDSGFQSLDDAVAAMGDPLKRYKRMAIYGAGDDRVVFSDFVLYIDEAGTKG